MKREGMIVRHNWECRYCHFNTSELNRDEYNEVTNYARSNNQCPVCDTPMTLFEAVPAYQQNNTTGEESDVYGNL